MAWEAGAAGKLSGAGGGDCAVVLALGDSMASRVTMELERAGLQVIPVELAHAGPLVVSGLILPSKVDKTPYGDFTPLPHLPEATQAPPRERVVSVLLESVQGHRSQQVAEQRIRRSGHRRR